MKVVFDSTGILGFTQAEGLLPMGLAVIEAELKKYLLGRVKAAYIFGSYARQEHSSKSDLDLILIKDTDKKFHQRVEDFEDLYDSISPDLDILVYTSKEFEKSVNQPAVGFWKKVTSEMKRII